MAIEQKEVYVVTMKNGEAVSATLPSFRECIELFGEENIVKMEKIGDAPDFEGV